MLLELGAVFGYHTAEGGGGWTSGSPRTSVSSADPGVSLCPKVPSSSVTLREESYRGARVSFPRADIDERKTTSS